MKQIGAYPVFRSKKNFSEHSNSIDAQLDAHLLGMNLDGLSVLKFS